MRAIAIVQMVFGALTASTALCPCPWSKAIMGALVLVTGAVTLVIRRK